MDLLKVTEKRKNGKRIGLFRCECGQEFETLITSVNTGNTKSCGCLVGKTLASQNKKHGMSNHCLYPTWQSQKQRCTNKKNKAYKNYGGRGLSFDKGFIDFKKWLDYVLSLEDAMKKDFTIDRKNNNIGYIKGNLRWTNRSVQMANTRLLKKTNKSGYRGVCNCRGKWQASIQFEGNRKYLGVFCSIMDAAKTYDDFIRDNNLPFELNIKDGNYTIQENKLGLIK